MIEETNEPDRIWRAEFEAYDDMAPWADDRMREARSLGLMWIRLSHHPVQTTLYVFEAWKVRPKDEGPVRYSSGHVGA